MSSIFTCGHDRLSRGEGKWKKLTKTSKWRCGRTVVRNWTKFDVCNARAKVFLHAKFGGISGSGSESSDLKTPRTLDILLWHFFRLAVRDRALKINTFRFFLAPRRLPFWKKAKSHFFGLRFAPLRSARTPPQKNGTLLFFRKRASESEWSRNSKVPFFLFFFYLGWRSLLSRQGNLKRNASVYPCLALVSPLLTPFFCGLFYLGARSLVYRRVKMKQSKSGFLFKKSWHFWELFGYFCLFWAIFEWFFI